MLDLEVIFGDGQQVAPEEHLYIYKSFVEDPSEFTLHGLHIDLIDVKELLNFVLNVLECKTPTFNKKPFSNLAVNLVPQLLRFIRQKLCPFSAKFKSIKRWDAAFYNALVCSVLHNNSRPTWRRLFMELVINDLDAVPNFDGSKGIVTEINAAALNMASAVQSGDLNDTKNSMKELVEHLKWISPASITIPALNDWSLLHLAASAPLPVEIYKFMIETMECDAQQTDRMGRTALHVAAASLNYNAMKVLATKCAASIKMLDTIHQSPLALLLRCVSMRPWRKWIESHHLQEILALFVRSNPAQLWSCGPVDTSSNSGVRCAEIEHVAAKQSFFYQAVVYTDDFVAEEVVKLARLTPTTDWDVTAIKETLYKCSARPRDRPATVELLFREMVNPLQDRGLLSREDLLDLVDYSICAAVLSLKHTKHRRDVLKSLLERYVSLVQVSTGEQEVLGTQAVAFLYLGALSGDADLLTFVLAALPRTLVRALIYPRSMQHSATREESNPYFGTSFKSKLRRFCHTLEAESLDFVVQSSLSPLSLMCALHRADIVHVLLRACYELPAHIDTPAGQAAAHQSELDHFYPLYWATLCGASECIRLVHTTLSKESLQRIYFYMPGPESRSIFQEVLAEIGQNLPFPRGGARNARNDSTHASLRHLGTTKHYAECLQLVLDCLPAVDSTPGGSEQAPANVGPLHLNSGAPTSSVSAVKLLQTRLEQVNSAVDSISDRAVERTDNGEISEQWTAPYSELLVTYTNQKTLAQRVCTELNSKYIQTNLRLICKKFTPDKKWIKLAYCVNRLVRALPSSLALKDQTERTVGEIPDVIDLASWKAFLSLMSKASKTSEQIDALTTNMTEALRRVFTPHALLHQSDGATPEEVEMCFDQLAAVCAVVERIWNDNQIVVLSRAKSPVPGSYGETTDPSQDLPHYQVNDFKPDQRDVTTYAALQGWLLAMLRGVKYRSDFKTRLLGNRCADCVEANKNETVLEHLHMQQLRAEKSRIEALLSGVEPSSDIPASPVSYLLKHVATKAIPSVNLVHKLRAELFHGGLCAKSTTSRRREETEKNKQVDLLDKLTCVLVEFNSRLGGTSESLLRDVLPLCALGLWKASELIVKEASKQGHHLCSSKYSLMQHLLVCTGRTFPSKYAICEALMRPGELFDETSALNLLTFHLLTPLHCAVIHRQGTFVKTFLNAFPDFPVDFASIALCAKGCKVAEWLQLFFAHCSGVQSQAMTQRIQASVWTNDVVLVEDMRGKVLGNEVVELANLATNAAEKLSTESKDPNIVLHPPFSLMRDGTVSSSEGSPRPDSVVLLMNGTRVTWSELVADPRLLALTMPAPQRAGGLFGTGHNLLHEAASLPSPDLAFALLRSSPDWRNRIFQADKTGCTSLYNALQRGHLELADTMLRYFEHDVSMHKNHILSELCTQQSAPPHRASVAVREAILNKESQELLAMEKQLYIPRVHKASTEMAGKLTPFYGLRDYAITGSVDVLARYLQGIDLLWKKIVSADSQLLMHVFHYPGCAQLDSVIRARQVIALLGIPLSQLAVPSTDAARKLQSATYRVKDFSNLNPQALKTLVSWPTAVQFRGIVCGWYRQRTVTTPSQLDDTYFLFRNSDVGILDLGRCGTEVGRFLRSNAAFQRACDRVRVNGVQPHLRSDITSGLEEQLRMEFRFDPSSASRENMLRSGHLNGLNQRAAPVVSSAKVNNLLLSMQVDATTCANVLSLSYLILDFARALCVARQLIGITSEPSPRQAQSVHPLDTLHATVASKRIKVEQLKLVLGLQDSEKRSMTGEGVNSLIRICACLQPSDLRVFFRINATQSERFAKLRGFVTEGLAAVLLDQGHLQLAEFVCRQALRSDEVASADVIVSEAELVPRVSSKFSKIVDPELGFELVLRALQNLRVLDAIKVKGGRVSAFAKKHERQFYDLVHSSSSEFALDSAELQATVPQNTPATDPKNPHILREVSAYATKRDQLRSTQEFAESKEKNLQKAYGVAQAIFDLIAAVAHLAQDNSLYHEDVHQHIVNAQNKSPLTALCLQAESRQKRSTLEPYRLLADDRAKVEAELDCCKRLLVLGASAIVSDSHGRSPIAVAALSGRADLLKVLLESTVREELPSIVGYAHLVWHTLLATAGASSQVNRKKTNPAASCVELLLQHDFPAEAPSGCDYSSLELAALLQYDAALLLKLCEARKSVPTAASLHRTCHFLMLRGPRCPVDVVELLLKKVEKSSLTELYSVLGVLSEEEFLAQVVQTHANYIFQVLAPVAEGYAERQLYSTIERALTTIKAGRPHVPRHITSTVDVDLAAACSVWRSRSAGQIQSAEEETPSDIFELTFSSRNANLVAAVMRHLSSSPFAVNPDNKSVYFVPPREGRSDGDAGFLLSQVLCCACVHDSSEALELLEKMYSSWRTGDAAAKTSQLGQEEEDAEVRAEGEVALPPHSDAPSWSELLNHAVRCAELNGRTMSPLEIAVQCNSSRCVAYLLGNEGITVSCGLFLRAICTSRTDQHTALQLLQHLAPDKDRADVICAEFGDFDSFLTCTQHDVADQSGVGASLQGETVLHLCCRRGYAVLVKHLLELGADPLLLDEHGCSALVNAVAGGHRSVTRLMYPYCSPKIQQAIAVLVYMTRKILLSRGRLKM